VVNDEGGFVFIFNCRTNGGRAFYFEVKNWRSNLVSEKVKKLDTRCT